MDASPYLAGNNAPVVEETTAFDLAVVGQIPTELEGQWLGSSFRPEFRLDSMETGFETLSYRRIRSNMWVLSGLCTDIYPLSSGLCGPKRSAWPLVCAAGSLLG